MSRCLPSLITCLLLPSLFCSGSATAQDLRDRAVLKLNFDDDAAPLADLAAAGKVKDVATLPKDGSRIPSAFIKNSSGRSLLLDPAKGQQLVIASSEDLARPDAVTISALFASLHPDSDATFHGLFAKRNATEGNPTNYGINFGPSTDNLQLYINAGGGYKVVNFSAKAALGSRRRVHLTASFDNADAPAADADADVDDVRVRLFINGQPLKPTGTGAGLIEGNTAWLTDVSLATCVSNTPFTVGSSFTDGELTRLICDDLFVFAEALSDADAKTLFELTTAASAAEIAAEQSAARTTLPTPVITRLSQHSAEIGRTTRITVYGQNLASARLYSDVTAISCKPVDSGTAEAVAFDVTVPLETVPGRCVVRCVTNAGVSNAAVIACDRVPTAPDGTFTESAPAETLPVSVAGILGGTEQKRVWFKAKAGQKIIAEADARRLGSTLDPVVEIRSQQGGPLAVQWQQPDLLGDARAAVVIPADGLYYAELHDLQFQAPGGSIWRLFVGDLPPSAAAYPPVLTSAETAVRTASGDGVSQPVSLKKSGAAIAAAASPSIVLPLPPIKVEPGTHIVEPIDATWAADPVDATFTAAPFPALLASGRIATPKEQDVVNVKVTPKQSLHLSIAARGIASPLRPHLMLYNGENLVAQNDGEAGAGDPALNYDVPDGVAQLQVRIRDVSGKGSPGHVYRLQIARTDRQAFLLTTRDAGLRLPANGSVPLRISVIRQSPSFRYTGPIRLSLSGPKGLTVVPEVIPPQEGNHDVLLMITRNATVAAENPADSLRIEARTEGAEPAWTTTLKVEGLPEKGLTLPGETILTGPGETVPAVILPAGLPPVLFRGLPATLSVQVLPLQETLPGLARFDMQTTEPRRREDPGKPDSPLKPAVGLADFQFAAVRTAVTPLTINVPLDTPSKVIDAVISAEFVDQPLAPEGPVRAWTAPIRFSVENAVSATPPAEPVRAKKATMITLPLTIRRNPLFREPVSVVLEGLPAGITATPASIAAEHSTADLAISIADNAAAGETAGITAKVLAAGGQIIQIGIPVRLVVE
ncbi:MAG: hypothetical protein ACK5TG_06315 [Planctomyces sp.]